MAGLTPKGLEVDLGGEWLVDSTTRYSGGHKKFRGVEEITIVLGNESVEIKYLDDTHELIVIHHSADIHEAVFSTLLPDSYQPK